MGTFGMPRSFLSCPNVVHTKLNSRESDTIEPDYCEWFQQSHRPVALEAKGLPYFATTYALNLLVTNMSVTTAVTHLFLWNRKEMMAAFTGSALAKLRRTLDPRTWTMDFWKNGDISDPVEHNYDPHYKLMTAYKACPN